MDAHLYQSEEPFVFYVTGVNHHRSPVSAREKFALSQEQIHAFYERARHAGVSSVMVLATCNRTEVFTYTGDICAIHALLREITGVSTDFFESHVFTLENEQAYQHTFEVASGLDSQVLGDYQIVNQFKDAYDLAHNLGFDDAYLSRLIQMVFHAGKRIKNETQLSAGKSSVSSVAVHTIKQKIADPAGIRVLIYGAGKIGRIAAEQLLEFVLPEQVTIINRTSGKADSLAHEFGFKSASSENLEAELAGANVLITATSSPDPVVLPHHFQGRNNSSLLALDLSVPRNIHPEVDAIPGIEVIQMDDLKEIQDETARIRQASIAPAQEIIAEKMAELTMWLNHRKYMPYVQQLRTSVEARRVQVLKAVRPAVGQEEFRKLDENSAKIADKAISNYIAYLRRTPHNAANFPVLDVEAIQFFEEE